MQIETQFHWIFVQLFRILDSPLLVLWLEATSLVLCSIWWMRRALRLLLCSIWRTRHAPRRPIEFWPPWLNAAAAGAVVSLFTTFWPLPTILRGRASLFSLGWESARPLILIGPIAAWIFLATFSANMNFWRRYARTLSLRDPPAPYLALIATAISAGGIVFHYLGAVGLPRLVTSPLSVAISAVLLIFFFGPFCAAWISPEPANATTKTSSAAALAYPYADEPIEDEAQDLLGRGIFVRRLHQEIAQLPGKECFVFSLTAGWGEGKTSALRLLQRLLENDHNAILVEFNPWYFATDLAIVEAFYASIDRALRERYLVPGLRQIFKRYLGILSLGLHHVPLGLELRLPDSPEALRQKVERFIERMGLRLVIVIDDVDRLSPDLAMQVLELTSLSARFSSTVFLLAFDQAALETTLKNKNLEPRFLEKVVQRPAALPPAEQRDIDGFLRSAVDQLFDDLKIGDQGREQFDRELVEAYAQYLRPVFRNLRQAKRFLNVLRSSLPPVADEVNLFDFFLLTVLQVFATDIYRDIWSHSEFYIVPRFADFPGYRMIGLDDAARRKEIETHVRPLLGDRPERFEEALRSLFPEVDKALEERRFRGSPDELTQRAEQRISHAECFPTYFLGRIPTGELSDGEVLAVLRRWNEAGDGFAQLMLKNLRTYKEAGQLAPLLERLRTFSAQIDPVRASEMIRTMAEYAVNLADDRRLITSEFRYAVALVLEIAEKHGASKPEQLLYQAVDNGPPLFVAALVAFGVDGRRTVSTAPHAPALIARASDRFKKHFVESGRDVFEDLPDSFGRILYQWATNWTQGPRNPVVEEYVVRLIKRKPQHLGHLLTEFAKHEELFSRVFAILSQPTIEQLADHYRDEALPSQTDKQALQLFRNITRELKARQAQKSEPPQGQ